MNIDTKKTNLIEKVFCISLVLSIVGNVYHVGNTNLGYGELILFFSMAFCLIVSKGKALLGNKANPYFVFFITYSLLITFINAFLYRSSISMTKTAVRLLRDGFYIVTIFVFSKSFFSADYTKRIFKYFCIVLSCYIIIQFVFYVLFGIYVPGLIDGLPIDAGTASDYKAKALSDAKILGFIRPNGFLGEPAQCAHVLSLGLLLALISTPNKASKICALLFSVAMVCTTSLNAIILLLFDFVVFFLKRLRTANSESQFGTLVSFVFVLTLIVISYNSLPFVQTVVSRLSNLGTTTNGSVAIRVLRGPVFYLAMPLTGKLFGIGFGNFVGYREAVGLWTAYEETVEYFGMNAYILISTGLVGSLLLILSLIRYMKDKAFFNRAVICLLFVAGISSSIYSTPFIALALSFAIFDRQEQRNTSNIQYGKT